MTDAYIYIRKNNSPSKAVPLQNVMAAARLRIASGMVDYHLREDEAPQGPALSRPVLLQRLRNKLMDAEVGTRFRVYADAQNEAIFRVHKVQPSLVIVDINGNDHSDIYYSTIISTYPQYEPRYAGCYVCKDIAGSWVLSQHSYGNAVDFFFDSLAQQDIVFEDMIARHTELHIHTLISRTTIWTAAEGKHYYDGEYHSHLHADFDPQFSGSCGVREP